MALIKLDKKIKFLKEQISACNIELLKTDEFFKVEEFTFSRREWFKIIIYTRMCHVKRLRKLIA